MNFSRRNFLTQATLFGGGLIFLPRLSKALSGPKEDIPIPAEITREFVLKAHSDFETVEQLLKDYPNLLNATVDWGDGDFESAIGAMGHMGFRDQALFMIEKGARFDLFVLAMLGKLNEVKTILQAFPNLLNSIGPHGFTLLHHAEVGGKEAEDVYAYLWEKGLKEKFIPTFDRGD